mgnify:FL=1
MAEHVEHLCVATLPDQRKYRFGTYDFDRRLIQALARIVREAGITTERKNPQKINVHVARLKAPTKPGDDWETIALGLYQVMPPPQPMTKADFDAESRQLLLRIPPQLHAPFHQLAWDQRHAGGLEEVFNYLLDYVSVFEKPLAEYRRQLLDRDSPGA